ncbi:MAG: glycosyltransferase [Desulfobacterales bacterium]|nr:glycosyltransferase [Desulfobacterales bacterium]
MPKVSVIIPTYNRQYVIVKTVESVLNQNKVLRLRRAIDGYKFR